MVIELGAARAMTPVFGGSITVWAVVIAVTMLALALGYAAGGVLADRHGGLTIARGAAVLAAVLIALAGFARPQILAATIGLSTVTGATVATTALIALPLAALGAVSPALIKGLADDDAIGGTAGRVFAVSTLGSLVGTVLAGVWLLPWLRPDVVWLGTSVVVALAAAVQPSKPGATLAVVLLVVATGMREPPLPRQLGAFVLQDVRQSPHGELRVIDRHRQVRLMVANGIDQGGMRLHGGQAAFTYGQVMSSVVDQYRDPPARVLMLGLGPGVIAKRLAADGAEVTTVEIDPVVVELARTWFDFDGDVVVADGRRFLHTSGQQWDVIYVDVFANGSPPWPLFTVEAIHAMASRLTDGGMVVMNLRGNEADPAQKPAIAAIAATAKEVFATVDAYPDPMQDRDPVHNIYLALSHQPRRTTVGDLDPRRVGPRRAIENTAPTHLGPGRILTDDASPLEALVAPTVAHLRNEAQTGIPAALLLE